jgi:hypothetical protein
MEAKSSATGLSNFASALDAGMWLAEASIAVFITPYSV